MDRKEIRCVRESDGIWRFFFSFRGVVWRGLARIPYRLFYGECTGRSEETEQERHEYYTSRARVARWERTRPRGMREPGKAKSTASEWARDGESRSEWDREGQTRNLFRSGGGSTNSDGDVHASLSLRLSLSSRRTCVTRSARAYAHLRSRILGILALSLSLTHSTLAYTEAEKKIEKQKVRRRRRNIYIYRCATWSISTLKVIYDWGEIYLRDTYVSVCECVVERHKSLFTRVLLSVCSRYTCREYVCRGAAAPLLLLLLHSSLSLFSASARAHYYVSLFSLGLLPHFTEHAYTTTVRRIIFIYSLYTRRRLLLLHTLSLSFSLSLDTALRHCGAHPSVTTPARLRRRTTRRQEREPTTPRRGEREGQMDVYKGGRAVLRWVGGERGERLLLAGMRYIYIYTTRTTTTMVETHAGRWWLYICVCVWEREYVTVKNAVCDRWQRSSTFGETQNLIEWVCNDDNDLECFEKTGI